MNEGHRSPASRLCEWHRPLSDEKLFKTAEVSWFDDVTHMIEAGRKIRDS